MPYELQGIERLYSLTASIQPFLTKVTEQRMRGFGGFLKKRGEVRQA